jgi:hypothetical protein
MPDDLDELIGAFVESEYTPDGAEIEGEQGHGHGEHGEHGHGHEAGPSVREFEYRGHSVRIVTHYEVTIDGEAWTGPIHVLPDGNVVSHTLPQYLVPSAVDLISAVIDETYEAPEEVRAAIDAAREDEAQA